MTALTACSTRRGTAVPLVKATLRGILPHGSEAPWVPIPLRSADLDDSPSFQWTGVGFVPRRIPFSTRRTPAHDTAVTRSQVPDFLD